MMFLKLRHNGRDCKDTTFFTVNKRVAFFFVSLGMKQKLLSIAKNFVAIFFAMAYSCCTQSLTIMSHLAGYQVIKFFSLGQLE